MEYCGLGRRVSGYSFSKRSIIRSRVESRKRRRSRLTWSVLQLADEWTQDKLTEVH